MRPPADFPHPLTTFVGREKEVEDIVDLLQGGDCRLLTVLGPGGIGKSRLAMQAGRQLQDCFDDGAHWIDLQASDSEETWLTAMARTLGLSFTGNGSPADQLIQHLKAWHALLICDNLEQLTDDAAFLSALLKKAPAVSLLVTSRRALHIEGEWLYPLDGLPYPTNDDADALDNAGANYAAVALFAERAQRVSPTFSLHAERDGVLRICRLVNGSPLALEIAASWVRNLDCSAIAGEIENNLNFLTSPLRNAPQRHRSMQAVFARSWSILAPEEQKVLAQLSVFQDSLDREAAAAVAGATLPLLASLVDHSLLDHHGEGRYRLHGLLRQYAATQLARSTQEEEGARLRHATHFLERLAQLFASFMGQEQQQAGQEIEADFENVRAAWLFAVEQEQFALLFNAIESLTMFIHLQSRYLEGTRLLQIALRKLQAGHESARHEMAGPLRLLLLSEAGWLDIRLGQFQSARRQFEECVALYRALQLEPLPGMGTDPRLGLSVLASIAGNYEEAATLIGAALHQAEAQGHRQNEQTAHFHLASIAYALGDYERARGHARAARETCRETGDRWFEAYSLNELGRIELALSHYAAAREHFEACYALRAAFNDREGMALALNGLGEVALGSREPEEARTLFERSLARYSQIGDRGGMAAAHSGLGRALAALGDVERAREQFATALSIAVDIRFAPQLLSVLMHTGIFLLEMGRGDAGSALCAFGQEHPATPHHVKTTIDRRMKALSVDLGPHTMPIDDVQAAVALAQQELRAVRAAINDGTVSQGGHELLVEPLTERELEVLALVAQGLTNRQIAEELTVVVGTVKAHNNNIYGKLGVSNRMQAVTRARELRLIAADAGNVSPGDDHPLP